MSTITLNLSGLSGSVSVEIPEGATLADAREAASIPASVGFAAGGSRVSDESSYQPSDNETVTTLPPEVKAGS